MCSCPVTGAAAPYDEAVPRHRLTVYLHVGPPKTGTTYLQDVLWRNRALSRSHDLDLPGSRVDHFQAALDLRGISFGGYDNPDVHGAWDRLVGQALQTDLGKVLISHEVLAGATDSQIEQAVSSLAPATVHVVYGARDLARQLPAVWQESLKNQRTRTFEAFLAAALKPRPSIEEPRGFWRSQDSVATLERWASAVPPHRIHVVTLPQPGAPANSLWERFSSAIGLDPRGYNLDVARTNSSLPPEDAEVLRRLNSKLADQLDWPAYEYAVKRRFNARANTAKVRNRLVVPVRYRDSVVERARMTRDALAEAGYAVCGDLDDLLPATESFGDPVKLSLDAVSNAAVEVLATVLTEDSAGRASDKRVRARRRARALRSRLWRG